MKNLFLSALVLFAVSASPARAQLFYPIVKCDGLTLDLVQNYYGRPTRQLVLRNAYGAFDHLGRLMYHHGNPTFIRKWSSEELVIAQVDVVKWDAEFVTYDYGRSRLLTATRQGDKMVVRVYNAQYLNIDNGTMNPSTLRELGNHVYNDCRSF